MDWLTETVMGMLMVELVRTGASKDVALGVRFKGGALHGGLLQINAPRAGLALRGNDFDRRLLKLIHQSAALPRRLAETAR